MIDSDDIKECIKNRHMFSISSKGIKVSCIPYLTHTGWTILIPKASISMDVTDISVLEDEDYYHLTYENDCNGVYYSLLDLSAYEKFKRGYL